MQRCKIILSHFWYASDKIILIILDKLWSKHLMVIFAGFAHSINLITRFSDLEKCMDKESRFVSSIICLNILKEKWNTCRKI